MQSIKTLSITLAITLLTIGSMFAETDESKTMSQTICPVMTFGDIGCSVAKKDIYTDFKGKRIYFCSKECVEKFKKTPEKYIQKLESKGVVLEDVPETEHKNKNCNQ